MQKPKFNNDEKVQIKVTRETAYGPRYKMFEISKNSYNQNFSIEEYGLNLTSKNNKIIVDALKWNGLAKKSGFEKYEVKLFEINYDIFSNGEQIGRVTSGTQSPSLKKGIGLGYVEIEYANPGTKIDIDIRGLKKSATIMEPPLYKKGTVY